MDRLLESEEKGLLISNMAGLLFDLDGVFYVGNEPVPGAVDTLEWFRQRGIPYLFLTNTTSKSRSGLVDKLRHIDIDTDESHLLTPPVAAVRWIQDHVSGPSALFVPEATFAEFAALDLVEPGSGDVAGAVVLGDLGETWDFRTFNAAFRMLMCDPQPALVALGMTRYWQAADGLRLDVGAYVSGLQYATGVKPSVMGKPAAPFFQSALDIMGCTAEQVIMIGDDIRGYVDGAQSAGISGLLVRTGKFQASDLDGDIEPAAVLDSIADLPEWWRAADHYSR